MWESDSFAVVAARNRRAMMKLGIMAMARTGPVLRWIAMQTDYLRYFIDVVTLGSMSSAAKKNYMTPQGISRSISALEADLGCELFKRDSNKVVLTRFGSQLLKDARKLLECENDMRHSIIELQSAELKKSHVHFTCYSSPIFFDTPLFFPVSGLGTAMYAKVQFLQRSTPNVVDLLVEAARSAQPNEVFVGGLGFFGLFRDESTRFVQRLIDAGYEYRPFMRTNDYVLVPEYSTLARMEKITQDEMRSRNLAVAATGGMERAISRHVGAESIYVSSGDSAYRSYLCRRGEALTFVPGASLVFGAPEGTVAVPMQEPYTIEIGFAARPSAFDEGILADAIVRLSDFYSPYKDEGLFELLDGSAKNSPFST